MHPLTLQRPMNVRRADELCIWPRDCVGQAKNLSCPWYDPWPLLRTVLYLSLHCTVYRGSFRLTCLKMLLSARGSIRRRFEEKVGYPSPIVPIASPSPRACCKRSQAALPLALPTSPMHLHYNLENNISFSSPVFSFFADCAIHACDNYDCAKYDNICLQLIVFFQTSCLLHIYTV